MTEFNNTSQLFGKTSILGVFYTASRKNKTNWSLKCKICTKRIHSNVGITSNFHRRYAKVS